jgi:hypothetical protein
MKIIVTGKSGVGKTAAIHKLVCNARGGKCRVCNAPYQPTKGCCQQKVPIYGVDVTLVEVGGECSAGLRNEAFCTADGIIIFGQSDPNANENYTMAPATRTRFVHVTDSNLNPLKAPIEGLVKRILEIQKLAPVKELKIVVVGPARVGKTYHILRLIKGDCFIGSLEYIPTVGVEVRPIRVSTKHGDVLVNLWDTAGQPELRGLGEGNYLGAHGAIVWLNLDCEDVEGWKDSVRSTLPAVPIHFIAPDNDAVYEYQGLYGRVHPVTRFKGNPMRHILSSLVDEILESQPQAPGDSSSNTCEVWLRRETPTGKPKMFRTLEAAYEDIPEGHIFPVEESGKTDEYYMYTDSSTGEHHVYPVGHMKELRKVVVDKFFKIEKATLHE